MRTLNTDENIAWAIKVLSNHGVLPSDISAIGGSLRVFDCLYESGVLSPRSNWVTLETSKELSDWLGY